MNSTDEKTVRQVLNSIAQATSLFREQAVAVERLPSVKKTLTAVEFYRSDRSPIVSGYLDAELTDGTAISWLLDLTWTDDTWTIESKLAKSSGGEQDILQKLPMIIVQRASDLPQKLVETLSRLLELRPPFLQGRG